MRISLVFLMLLTLMACSTKEEKGGGKPVIGVSILPQKYLVSGIADTLADVVVMVPPGASPATYEATAAQMSSLAGASVYFRIGHIGFERAWMSKIRELNPGMHVVDLSEGFRLRGLESRHEGHSHTGVDPHVWMSPANMEAMARKVYHELQYYFPEDKDFLRQNYEHLMRDIRDAKSEAKRQLMPHAGKTFLIFHPSLGYLADDFGLVQESIEYEGKEPSPAHMKGMIDLAGEKNIKVIFVQKEFDQRNAAIIAEEIGGTVVTIDPLSESWGEELRKTVRALSSAMNDE
jgi:zinc transport system substrate-binding protein